MLNAASGLIDEGNFDATEGKLSLRAMDPSHVAMIELFLPKEIFEEYDCATPTRFAIGIGEILKLLKGISADETLEFVLDEKERKVVLDVKGKYARTFRLPTVEVMGEEVPTPKLSFNAKVRMLTSALKHSIIDAAKVGDHAKFTANEDEFVMEASGDIGFASMKFRKGSEALLDLSVKEASTAIFSLSYLDTMVSKSEGLADVVTLEFSTNQPLKLDFELPSEGLLRFYLAPRIESE